MVAGNGDGIEFRHVFRRVPENVRDDAHGGLRRIDVGVAHHKFFENVILNGPRQCLRLHALLFGCHDVKCQNGEHGAVHGHANGHLVEWNALKQPLHVFHGINGHSGHAHITRDPRVIAVVAAVRRQVKSNAQSFLTGCEVGPVKGVGCLCSGKTGILPNGPRP